MDIRTCTFAVRKNILFGIYVVTFDVSSCTKFQIFQGSGSAMDPTAGGSLQRSPDLLAAWWGMGLVVPFQETPRCRGFGPKVEASSPSLTYIYTVSQKNCANLFFARTLSNFDQS